MHDLVRSSLLRLTAQPDRPLFFCGEGMIRAGQFVEDCRSCAHELGKRKFPPGAVIVLSAPAGPNFLLACVAAWMQDCVVLWADESCPPAVRERIAAAHGAAATWTLDGSRNAGGGDTSGQAALVTACEGPRVLWPGRAVIKLTSGTSGEPAGVLVTGSQLAADGIALAQAMGFTGQDRIVAAVPLAHSYGFSVIALPALLAGSSIVVPGDAGPLAAAAEHAATVLPSVPSWYRAQVERADPPAIPPSLRLLISAGELLEPQVASRFRQRFGQRIHVLYGASECGAIAFDRRGDAAERGSVGEPLPGVEVVLQDADPAAGRGLLAVRSAAIGERYVPEGHPAQLGDGRFVTDDLAEVKDGEIFLHGRLGSWVKIKGRRVDPREVAQVLEQHPEVSEAFVFGHAAPAGAETLSALVVGRGAPPGYRELVEWCRPRLEGWKIPRRIVSVPALPRTARGKVDRPAILAIASNWSAPE